MSIKKITLEDNESEDLRSLSSLKGNFPFSDSNKRLVPRKNCCYKLECKSYHSEKDIFETIKGVALNFSKCGLYFETNNLLESGSPVYISSENSLIDPLDAELAKGVHAQVVWCNSITNGSKPSYGVGLKFFERLKAHTVG
jgi:Tfp pilus assembly protein PilZ